jgi:hypothetical protein
MDPEPWSPEDDRPFSVFYSKISDPKPFELKKTQFSIFHVSDSEDAEDQAEVFSRWSLIEQAESDYDTE